jgi:hypothetical protein
MLISLSLLQRPYPIISSCQILKATSFGGLKEPFCSMKIGLEIQVVVVMYMVA